MSDADLPPLIGDPDAGFLSALIAQRQAASVPPLVAHTAPEIERVLEDPTRSFSAIFINPRIAPPWGIPVLTRARQLRPTTPIFYLHDGEGCPISAEDYRL